MNIVDFTRAVRLSLFLVPLRSAAVAVLRPRSENTNLPRHCSLQKSFWIKLSQDHWYKDMNTLSTYVVYSQVLLCEHSSLVWVNLNTFINFWIPAHFPVFQAQAELARMCPDLLTGWAWTTSTSSKFSALEVTVNLSIVFCYIFTALVNHILVYSVHTYKVS